jgi:tRNA pseudouridine38-40 synthase
MSRRYKLIVAYDGAPFSGWQSQPDGNAIQDHLERAIHKISGERVRVHGAGRTDAGVHALAQGAHVDLAKDLAPERWLRAINSALPPAIRVMQCKHASQTFHARFSAKEKIYRYRIWNGEVLPPHELGRAWHIAKKLDVDLMREAARLLKGEHDFAAFAANRGKAEKNTGRTLNEIKIRRRRDLIEIEFQADGFLYKMARMLTGALVDCGLTKITIVDLRDRLRGSKPRARMTAPACGLFLVRVRY